MHQTVLTSHGFRFRAVVRNHRRRATSQSRPSVCSRDMFQYYAAADGYRAGDDDPWLKMPSSGRCDASTKYVTASEGLLPMPPLVRSLTQLRLRATIV